MDKNIQKPFRRNRRPAERTRPKLQRRTPSRTPRRKCHQATLERRASTPQAKSDFIFPAEDGKQRRWVSATYREVIKELGFNDGITDRRHQLCFHSLRHSFASWLRQRNEPLSAISELMGHSTIALTERYSHLGDDAVTRTAYSLEGALEQKSAKRIKFPGEAKNSA